MKQPIVIEFAEIESVCRLLKEDSAAGLKAFSELTDKLKNFHTIVISENICNWPELIESLKKQFPEPWMVNFINQLLSARNLNFVPVSDSEMKMLPDPVLQLAKKFTPDKLLLGSISESLPEQTVNSYNTDRFIDIKELKNPGCVLFRIPRKIRFNDKEEITGLKFLAPYLRGAKKLEFIDKYLFTDNRFRNDLKFILSCLEMSRGIESVSFVSSPGKDSIEQYGKSQLRDELQYLIAEKWPSLTITYAEYNSKKEHDRFIIVNESEYTLRFSASFNNLMYHHEKIIVNKGFAIDADEGREYSG